MSIKAFFKGKTSKFFWVNVALMVTLLIAVPVIAFYMLDSFTHHGEKIEVPSVIGKTVREASSMLKDRQLVAVVNDSTYDKYAMPGSVLDQTPTAGYEVKGGRVIYLTIAAHNAPLIKMPDVVSHGSLREAESTLKSLGFRLTPHEIVEGMPLDLVIGVKQRGKEIKAGDLIPRDRPVTIIVGGGEVDSTMVDSGYHDTDADVEIDDNFGL